MNNACVNCILALGDKTRVSIYRSLNIKPKFVSEINELFNLGQPTISYHLKILLDQGLIYKTIVGRKSLYSVSKNCSFYNKICALKTILN